MSGFKRYKGSYIVKYIPGGQHKKIQELTRLNSTCYIGLMSALFTYVAKYLVLTQLSTVLT